MIETTLGEMNGPYMQLGGNRRRFLFTDGMGIKLLTEPEKHGPMS